MAPYLTVIHRSRQQVQNRDFFSVNTSSLVVTDALVTPTDWKIDVEGSASSGYSKLANFIAQWHGGRATPPFIDPTKGQFTWTGELETPAREPRAVVSVPPDISITEQMPHPAGMGIDQPMLFQAKDDYSYTTKASSHKTLHLRVLAKVVQKRPDINNGGQLLLLLLAYDNKAEKWKIVANKGSNPNLYQHSTMALLTAVIDRESDEELFQKDKDNGTVYLKWRVELRNGTGQKKYGEAGGRLVVWAPKKPMGP